MCGEEGYWARDCKKGRKRKLRCFHCQRMSHKGCRDKFWKCGTKGHIERDCKVGERKEAGASKSGEKDREKKNDVWG